jgi:DNA replication protein
MLDKVIKLLKDNSLLIPKNLIVNYKKLGLSDLELIVLIYLISEDGKSFNPKKISSDLDTELATILETTNNLTSKDLLRIEVRKNNNIREEYIVLDNLYHKLAFFIINEQDIKPTKSNLFDIFEKEFGRTLSPIEYELISGWQDGEATDELILLALKEAVYNGVFNFRYIDKILYEWKKKGIKNKEDIEKDRSKFHNKPTEKKELFDYDWLNEKE